ncbi:Lsr2-like DNA bridging protein [Streptomyces phage phiScoe55]|nr:Lsr2-like DNA bridging protein [Streptomyces phage phiScoe55]
MKNQRVIIELVDDIDGTGIASTVSFGLDGKMYEIELNKKNEKALRKSLQPWLNKAREVRSPAPSRRGRRKTKVDSATVRQWAAENDVEVSSTGRVAQSVIDQYEAAQNGG